MRLIKKAFELAKKELGVSEIEGDENNPRILEYLKSVDLDESDQETEETPWCSCFVNFIIQNSGGNGTKNAMARSWLAWGKKLTIPEEGCIVILERGSDGYSGHVGFFVGYGENRDFIKLLGGNQKNKVCIKEYEAHKILGFRTSKD